MAPLRVLITNDDGYQARGIRTLAPAIAAAGYDVLVVAPLDDRSGVGSARAGSIGRPIGTVEETVDGITYIGIDGTPALAVTLARLGAFGTPPDLVASGINHGHNIGMPILHSGTVAAALTAASQGMSGLAVSIDAEDPHYLPTAAAIATEALGWLADEPAGTVITLNVPDRRVQDLEGARHANLAPIDRSRLTATTAPTGEPMVVLEDPTTLPDPTTDEALLAAGYVTVTPITGIQVQDNPTPAHYLDKRIP